MFVLKVECNSKLDPTNTTFLKVCFVLIWPTAAPCLDICFVMQVLLKVAAVIYTLQFNTNC